MVELPLVRRTFEEHMVMPAEGLQCLLEVVELGDTGGSVETLEDMKKQEN
jgi:hypothetical protein